MENKQQPKVSVIIPVYNTAPYLKEAVGSILNQTLKELQVIIVNDGSTDESQTILEELVKEDTRIEIYTQANQGQSVARNTALRHAKGTYIYFMDSDDILLPEALATCYNRCESQQLEFVFFDGDILCETATPNICWDYHRTQTYDEQSVYDGKPLFKTMLDRWTHRAVPWLLFINHVHLMNIRLTFYPGIIHEDELFTVLLYLQSKRVGCLKQNLVKHRVRSNSTMGKKYSKRNVDCYLIVMKELQQFTFMMQDGNVFNLVKQYMVYTLNKILITAKRLPIKDKIDILKECNKQKTIICIKPKTLIQFLVSC